MRPIGPARLLLAAAGVLLLAACGGGENGDDGDTATGGAGGAGGTVAVTGTDALAFEPTSLSTAAGEVTIELTCGDAVPHNVTIDETGEEVVACEGGETASGTVTLDAGDYTYFCSVAGHREAGMEGTLSVSG